MPVFRYETGGSWLKGNCHVHSTASDGGKTFEELAQMYAGAGYDFIFRTDHWVASNVDEDATEYPLLWLDGIELHGRDYAGADYHVVCLGRFEGLDREMGFVAAMEAARTQGGLIILAHPQWMGNSTDDALRWGFHGVETYNHVCRWLNGKGEGLAHWNAMLERRPNTLGLAVDDAHLRPEHPGWNGGWIMVQAMERSPNAILDAIRLGRFYSTCGPEFTSITCAGHQVTVQCSPAQFVRLVGPGSRGARIGSFDGQRFSEATFEVPADWSYVYLEIEDACGRRAWTNTLYVADE
jgi:predicted metal-dependent phosphoesterase TrpH